MWAIVSDIKEQINPQPTHSMENVPEWVKNCLNNHRSCQHTRRPVRLKPTRLLYLDPSQPDDIKIINVTEKDDYQYVTLSHRWGSPEPPKLSRSYDRKDEEGTLISLETLEKGKPISDLPRTFQDTIHIVKSCGLKYLWIDSLCIFQDKHGEENPGWMEEALKMADIYAGGAFNIAATHGRNSDAGLFPIRPILLPATRTTEGQVKILWQSSKQSFSEGVMSSELLSRGWVFQEVIFTPANLFCTTDEMWWSCSDTTCSDTFPGGVLKVDIYTMLVPFIDHLRDRKQAIMPGNTHPKPMESWTDMLRIYVGTSVTTASDRLVAIAGVANLFGATYPDQLHDSVYHSGIWLSKDPDCLHQLLWYTSTPCPSHTYSAECNIPSWSPLGLKGHVGYNDPVDPLSPFEFVRLCSSSLGTQAGTDNSGRVAGQDRCMLHVRGVLVNVTHVDHGHGSYGIACKATDPDASIDTLWDSADMAAKLGDTTALVFKVQFNINFYGILLKPLDGSRNNTDPVVWERCGFIKWDFNEVADMKHCCTSLGFEKYGLSCDDNGVLKKDVSTQSALEDIYIV